MATSGAVAAPTELTFAGWVAGRPGSAARFSVVGGSWRGVIDLADGSALWWVQPLSEGSGGGQAGAAADQHVVYAGDAVVADGHGCPGGIVVDGAATDSSFGRPKGTTPLCVLQTQIAFDADFLYYQQNGSSSANVQADIDSIVNAMNLIYAHDTLVSFTTTQVIVRTAAGLYNSTSPSTLLTQMASEWTTNQTGVTRDIAHLMTGQPTGTTIGLAYNGAVCSTSFGYGLSQSRYTANMSLRVSLTCHEVGHNFSASHCDGDSDCSIMCSINGGCTGNVTGFSTRSINEIRPYSLGRACLTAIAGLPAQVVPHATADTAIGAPGGFVDIDVLANDYDGNCQTVTIQSFPASTPKGTLTRRIGAGPGGRDLIRYSASVGVSGTDTWTYVAADTVDGVAGGTVTVTIPAPKAPDYSGPTQAQLDGNYYRLQGQASVPDFTSLFNFVTGTFTNTPINWTSTTGNFSNSGRADYLGCVATATLSVPTAGSWTFFTQSDEGSLLYIDGVLVVNNDFVHTSQEHSGVVASLTAGNHALRVEYFELTGAAELIVKWQGPSQAKQVIPGTRLTSMQQKYYDLPPALSAIPSFAGLTAIANAPTTQINFPSSTGNFGASNRPTDVGAAFTGYISVPTSGLYTFYLESDDGSRMTLGASQVVVVNDGVHAMTEVGGQVALLAGLHSIKVEYFNGTAPSGLILRWEGPGIAKQVVPAANLLSASDRCNAADVGSAGGVGAPDGVLNNNDFIAFINFFFTSNPLADLGRAGGVTPGDGAYDNNDFIAFINYFFAPCN
ncbi:MAG: PA14 domain-containing protein [Phycisphaerales bacterium]